MSAKEDTQKNLLEGIGDIVEDERTKKDLAKYGEILNENQRVNVAEIHKAKAESESPFSRLITQQPIAVVCVAMAVRALWKGLNSPMHAIKDNTKWMKHRLYWQSAAVASLVGVGIGSKWGTLTDEQKTEFWQIMLSQK